MTKTDEHDPVGSTFESWLEEEGILEEATEHAVKAVISWQLQKTMAERAQQEVDGCFNGNLPIADGSASRPGERRRHLEKPDARRPPGRKKDQDRPRGCCLIQYAVMLIEAVRRPLPVTRLLRSARNDRKRTVIARSAATKQSRWARDCFALLAMTTKRECHCEERSDEAISPLCGNRRLSQFVEQRLGLFEVGGVEAFGEPAEDRGEQ